MQTETYSGLREQILHSDSVESANELMSKLASGFPARYVNRCKRAFERAVKRLTVVPIKKGMEVDGNSRNSGVTAPQNAGTVHQGRDVQRGSQEGGSAPRKAQDPRSQAGKMERRDRRRPYDQSQTPHSSSGIKNGLTGLEKAI